MDPDLQHCLLMMRVAVVQVQGGQGGGAGEPAQAPLPAAQPQSSPLLCSAHSPLAGGFT